MIKTKTTKEIALSFIEGKPETFLLGSVRLMNDDYQVWFSKEEIKAFCDDMTAIAFDEAAPDNYQRGFLDAITNFRVKFNCPLASDVTKEKVSEGSKLTSDTACEGLEAETEKLKGSAELIPCKGSSVFAEDAYICIACKKGQHNLCWADGCNCKCE